MKAFCIFDDFPEECRAQLEHVGIEFKAVPKGCARPSETEMKTILENFEIVIIGTSQKIQEWMWEDINTHRVVATASVGIDHIHIPEDKKHLLTILNTPTANAQSVAEYTIGGALLARKRLQEASVLYQNGMDNKKLNKKPEDLYGATLGLVGAGRISTRIMQLMKPFGVKLICYTKHPECHSELERQYHVSFVTLDELAAKSDIISVNVPNDASTQGLINRHAIERIKSTCIYISVSRPQVTNNEALLAKARENSNFYMILDYDVLPEFTGLNNNRNIVFTPHIAGGTIETRIRMFKEVTERICSIFDGEK